MKIKNKILIILGIAFLAISLLTANVNAADYAETPTYTAEDVIITGTIDDLGLGGKLCYDNWDYSNNKYINICLENVKQEVLNEYAKEAKSIIVDMKMNLPTYITKVTDEDGNELTILEENGERYVLFEQEVIYTNTSSEKTLDGDVAGIIFESSVDNTKCFVYYGEENYSVILYANVVVCSENIRYRTDNDFFINLVNKFGGTYESDDWWAGIGQEGDKYYLNSEMSLNAYDLKVCSLPSTINLSETYFQMNVYDYQGEQIEIEGFGTLYYAGKINAPKEIIEQIGIESIYFYKNSLDQLTQLEEIVQFKLKTKTGYEIICPIWLTYELDEKVTEETVTGTIDTELKHKDIGITIKGTGDGEYIYVSEYENTDKIFEKLKNKLNEVLGNKYNAIKKEAIDIFCAEYQGPLNLTFDVGTEYNGKQYLIGHLENGLHYEQFTGKVEDGKITIEVESLSPFMISILEEKPVEETPGEEQSGEQPGEDEPDEEQPSEEQTNGTGTSEKEEDTTKAPGKLPNAGLEVTIVFAIAMMIIVVAISYKKCKKLKDI